MKPSKSLARYVLLIGIILLILPVAIRFLNGSPLISGSEGYGHARIAEFISKNSIPAYDPAMPDRAYLPNAFDILLAGFAKIFGTEAAALIVPFLLGILTLICFSAVVRRWKLSQGVSLAVMAVFVLSPLFASAFAQAATVGLEIFLFVLFLLVISPPKQERTAKETVLLSIAAFVIAGVLASFSITSAIAVFALPMILRGINRKVQPQMLFSCIAALIVLFAIALPAFLQNEKSPFSKPVLFVQAVSDFGSAGGLSLFAWLLAIIGFMLLWQFKKKYYAAMIATGITIVVSLITPSAMAVAQILVAFLAGYALAFFAQMKWSFDDIRLLTVLVLVCGLLFSTLTQDLAIARGPPTKEIMDASIALGSLLPKNTAILSHPENGFWLEYWSGRQVFLDGWPAKTPDIAERWASAQAIWHAQDIMQARGLIYRNSIGAIVITKDMRDGLVWDLPEQDLLFLLRNNETFKNALHSSSVDIWTVNPR